MEWLLEIVKQYGLFAGLVAYILWFFDTLIKDIRKESAEREGKLLAIIDTLSDEVKDRLTKIEVHIRRK
jgi:hypothetical protein